jgi:hypothetical protein
MTDFALKKREKAVYTEGGEISKDFKFQISTISNLALEI